MCNGSMKIQRPSTVKNCPRCKTTLEVHHYRNLELDKCIQCEGLWIEPEKFSVLTSEFDVYRDDTSDPNYSRPGLPAAENYLPCPNCQNVMSRRNFKAISGVLIDACIHCGVWLDKDELQHIRNFIASGGLDKSQDRQLTKQQLDIEELEDRVSDLELMEKMINKFDLKRIFFRGF